MIILCKLQAGDGKKNRESKMKETRKTFCREEFSILQKIHLIIFDTIEFNNKEKYRRKKSFGSINFHESKLDEL